MPSEAAIPEVRPFVPVGSVRIEGFRGIREGVLEGLDQINVLVGRNNSGKTTVLEAVLVAGHVVSGGTPDVVRRDRVDQIVRARAESGPYADSWWYRRLLTGSIRLTLGLGAAALEVTIGRPEGGGLQVAHEGEERASSALARATLFDPRHAPPDEFEERLWETVLSRRGDRDLTQLLNELFGFGAEGFQYSPGRHVMATFPKHAVRVDDLGDGTRLAFRLLLLAGVLEETVLLVDELESHQHPGSLERLCHALAKAARLRRLQLFLTTHSRECVRFLLRAAEDEKVGATVLHTALDEEGVLRTRSIRGASALGIEDSGGDVRFLDLYA